MAKEQFRVDFPVKPHAKGLPFPDIRPGYKITIDEKFAREINAEIERLHGEIAYRDVEAETGLSLWRGECGHHWIKAESDGCPVCASRSPGGDNGKS